MNYYINNINNNKGIALVLALLMMVLISVVGLSAVMNTTTDISISGNVECADNALYVSDSASKQIANKEFISNVLVNRQLAGNLVFSGIEFVDQTNLLAEIQGLATYENDTDAPPATQQQINISAGGPDTSSQDFNVTVGNATARIDIDHLDVIGSFGGSIEAHSSYEGIGASLGSGGAKKLYKIEAVVVGTNDCASPAVENIYKCVLSGGGYCQ